MKLTCKQTTANRNPALGYADELLPTSILDLIQEHAASAEANGQLNDKVLNTLFENGLFKLFVPKNLGGKETDLVTALKVFERISSIDGACGWLVMIGAGGGLFSGFFTQQKAEHIFKDKQSVIAGSGAPNGTAKKVNGGYIINGLWPFASGALHANWFTANCLIEGSENEIISVAVPASEVTIHKTWAVFGMKATGSHDFSIKERFVRGDMTFSLLEKPMLDKPIFHCPLATLASLTFAIVAIGISKHALKSFTHYSSNKTMYGTGKYLAENERVRNAINQSQGLIENRRVQLYAFAENVWQNLNAEHSLNLEYQQTAEALGVSIVKDCLKAVKLLYDEAGMMPVFNESEFGRAWRDLHVMSQHAMLKDS